MFLWVTDFYSLGKIISAFPQIVLLYLKIAWRKKGGGEDGRRGFVLFGLWIQGTPLAPNSG